MLKNIITKLNFSVDIQELIDYHDILKTKYSHLDWSYDKCRDTIIKQWKDAAYADPANLLTHGWAIQSNLKDLSIPCPPWDISTLETIEYRNTELAFGIIERLQQAIPYGHRWSVSVQPNGGIVSLHSDDSDEMTVWIPIHTEGPVITFVDDENQIECCLPSDGSAYLLDTNIPHFTQNKSSNDRITIIFRVNLKHIDNLLSIEGVI